jgi:asparagine synthase (glutamine-hydrolysing)
VLAAAAVAARRHGLELPIPVSLRYPDAPETEESDWQELVVRHLVLQDWSRVTIGDELDLVGPIAARHLLRHGVLWPPNVHSLVPVAEEVRGGSVLTGYGGDHLLRCWPPQTLVAVLRGHRRPAWRDPLRLALCAAPTPVRYMRRSGDTRPMPWVTVRARRAFVHAHAHVYAHEPRSWATWLQWRLRRRGLVLAQRHLAMVARDGGVTIGHPLLDPGFLGALARQGSVLGMGDRARIAARVAGAALPSAVTARRTKALFDGAFWSEPSRRFVERWDGGGVDPALVRANALRIEWQGSLGGIGTAMLLQSAWLAAQPRRRVDVEAATAHHSEGDTDERSRRDDPAPR